ncbi:deoxycytidylate deaminase-like [Sitodiplosis mosellana]|uniref:deoxycytidylate deaminase-like n=1 Tax=Sitodiplosis mosellana TaxID=263140 RepID=UPI002443B396|nr:deoxycytidylate deaminase-like [Sitodiplosis mosellana]
MKRKRGQEKEPLPSTMESASSELKANEEVENSTGKRKNYLKWEDYFMSVALISAQRSKDPKTQVGACIVNEDKRIVGVGYNGFPSGVSDNEFSWNKPYKHLYVVHAEENAIIIQFSADLKNSTIYVSLFPCNRCAQIIIQSKIEKIVYMSDKKADTEEVKASKDMLDAVGIKYEQYEPSCKGLQLDLTDFDNQKIVQS